MKIWLNHKLACPDDDTFPLNLRIFSWESANEQFMHLLEGFRARNLFNFKDANSPLTIATISSSVETEKIRKNLDQMQTKSGIIQKMKVSGNVLLYDTSIISPVTIKEYFQMYQGILEEFSAITDLSESNLAKEVFRVAKEIIPIIQSIALGKLNSIAEEEKHFTNNLQELLYLNIYLTYFEIEEGLLICPHCKRWFPIIKTIPRIYPKIMKREDMDLKFKDKWWHLFPNDVVKD